MGMIGRTSLLIALSLALGGLAPARAEAPATLDHIAIRARDMAKSVAFYQDLFGLREVPAPFPGARWLVLGNGILLHIVGNRTAPAEHSRWDHIAIASGDMDATLARLAAKNVAWTNMEGKHIPQVRPDGVKQIFVQDPDGYWIEINDANRGS